MDVNLLGLKKKKNVEGGEGEMCNFPSYVYFLPYFLPNLVKKPHFAQNVGSLKNLFSPHFSSLQPNAQTNYFLSSIFYRSCFNSY